MARDFLSIRPYRIGPALGRERTNHGEHYGVGCDGVPRADPLAGLSRPFDPGCARFDDLEPVVRCLSLEGFSHPRVRGHEQSTRFDDHAPHGPQLARRAQKPRNSQLWYVRVGLWMVVVELSVVRIVAPLRDQHPRPRAMEPVIV